MPFNRKSSSIRPSSKKKRSVAGVQNELIIMCDNNGGVWIPRYRIDECADIFHTAVVRPQVGLSKIVGRLFCKNDAATTSCCVYLIDNVVRCCACSAERPSAVSTLCIRFSRSGIDSLSSSKSSYTLHPKSCKSIFCITYAAVLLRASTGNTAPHK